MRFTLTRFSARQLALSALGLCCFAAAGANAADTAAQKHFLWKVTGAKGVVYLLGTVHVGRPEFYPLPAVIEESFNKADTLIEEVDTGKPEAQRLNQLVAERGVYPSGDAVANHLSAVTRAHLTAYLKKSGQSEANIARMKPWLIAVMVLVSETKRIGLDPSLGLDKHFLEEARKLHKPIAALETASSQIELFTSIPKELEDQLLLSSLVEAEKLSGQLELLIRLWQSGDVEAMEELLNRSVSDYPQLKPIAKSLLDDRNDVMTEKIERFLDTSKTYFVAVGAAHLVGDRGIIRQLRAKQFTVEQQ
jgi:uncharacterized protein YbaP (TraB family)